MGMFRQCCDGWSHGQFGIFCQMLLNHSIHPDVEYFALFNGNAIPADKLEKIADELEPLATHKCFVEEGQTETMLALVATMRSHATAGLPLRYG